MQYLSVRKHDSPSHPVFSFMDGAPVSRQFFTEQLRLALSFCYLNLHQYQTHSSELALPPRQLPEVFQNFKSNTWGDGSQMR